MALDFWVFLKKRNKGQLTIELLFIIGLMVYIVQGFFLPNLNKADDTLQDLYNFAKLEASLSKIENAIDLISFSNDSRIEIFVFIPAEGEILCKDNKLSFRLKTKTEFRKCPAMECRKETELPEGLSFSSDCSLRAAGLKKIFIQNKNSLILIGDA